MLPHQQLEKEFSEYTDADAAVVVNTGTAALHLAVAGKHYPEGSEIIVPEFTMVATALGANYCGHKCVFVDCDDTMNIDENLIEDKITSNTKAIMVTHVYGRVAKIDKIYDLCVKYNLDLIEDCAEAHGARYIDGPFEGEHVGTLDIGCFSFYKNKIIHGEEGGAIITNDKSYASHLRDLRSMAFGTTHDYKHYHIGYNYRMSDTHAKEILKSLAEVDKNQKIRKTVEKLYDYYLLEQGYTKASRDVVWVYDIKHPCPDILVPYLNSKGIAARRVFYPMSLQPCFNVKASETDCKLKSLSHYQSTCYLPVDPDMSVKDIIRICDEIKDFDARKNISTV